jgi:hypothetical protein
MCTHPGTRHERGQALLGPACRGSSLPPLSNLSINISVPEGSILYGLIRSLVSVSASVSQPSKLGP